MKRAVQCTAASPGREDRSQRAVLALRGQAALCPGCFFARASSLSTAEPGQTSSAMATNILIQLRSETVRQCSRAALESRRATPRAIQRRGEPARRPTTPTRRPALAAERSTPSPRRLDGVEEIGTRDNKPIKLNELPMAAGTAVSEMETGAASLMASHTRHQYDSPPPDTQTRCPCPSHVCRLTQWSIPASWRSLYF